MLFYIFYKKQRKIKLKRPNLALNRAETFKLSLFWTLPIILDSTNQLMNFKRNKLRYQILPILKLFFNPKLEEALIKFIFELNLEKKYFSQKIKESEAFIKLYRLKYKKKNINKVKIFFTYLPLSLKKQIYKKALYSYLKNVNYYEINFLLKFNIKK